MQVIKDALASTAMRSPAALGTYAHHPLGNCGPSTASTAHCAGQGSHARLWCAIGVLAAMLAACVLLLLYAVTDVAVHAGVLHGGSCSSGSPSGWAPAQQHSMQGLLPQPDIDFVLV